MAEVQASTLSVKIKFNLFLVGTYSVTNPSENDADDKPFDGGYISKTFVTDSTITKKVFDAFDSVNSDTTADRVAVSKVAAYMRRKLRL